jgi:mono/diheme cytochrome c family protein
MTAMSVHPSTLVFARHVDMTQQSKRTFGLFAATAMFTAFTAGGALADSAGATFSDGDNFSEKTGQELYANVCQACHMDQGQGAVGAGKYPALAKNENLESGGYPVYVILHGQKGMPPVGSMMSDDQVAAVVNYVRTNFGNDYKDPVTPEDVAGAR